MKNKKNVAGFSLSKIARRLMLFTALLSPLFFIACAKERLDDIEKIDCIAPNKEIKDFSIYRAAALSTNNQQVSIRFQIDYCTITAGKNKQVTIQATNNLDGTTTTPFTLTLPANQKTVSNVIANLSLSDSGQTIPFTLTLVDDTGVIYSTSTHVAVPKFPSNISSFVTSNPINGATNVNVFRSTLDFTLNNGTSTQQEDPSGNLITVNTLVNNNLGSLQLTVGSTPYNFTIPNSNITFSGGSTQTASLAVDSTKFNNGSSAAPVQLQYAQTVNWTYYWDDNAGGTFFQSGTFITEANPVVQAGNPAGAGLENQYNIARLVNQSGTYYMELRNPIRDYAVKMIALVPTGGTIPATSVNAVTHFDAINNLVYVWGSASTHSTQYGQVHQNGHFQTTIDLNTGNMNTVNFAAFNGYETLAGIWGGFSGAPSDTKILFLEQSDSFTNTQTPVQSNAFFSYNSTEFQTINLASTNGVGPLDSLKKGDNYFIADQIGSISLHQFSYNAGGALNNKMSLSSSQTLSVPSNYVAATKIIDNPNDSQGVYVQYYDANSVVHLAQYSGSALVTPNGISLGASNIWQTNIFNGTSADILFTTVDLNGQLTMYQNSTFSTDTLGSVIYQYTDSDLTGLYNVNAFFRPKKNESVTQIPASVGEGMLWVDVPNGFIRKHTFDGKEVTASPYPLSIASDIVGMISTANVVTTKVIYRPGGDILIGQYQNGAFKQLRISVPGSAITPMVVASGVGDIKKIYGADVYLNSNTGQPTIMTAFEDPAKPDIITFKDSLGNSFDTTAVTGRVITAPFKLLQANIPGNKMRALVGTNKGFEMYEMDRGDISSGPVQRTPITGTLAQSPSFLTAIGADAASDFEIIDYQLTPESMVQDSNSHPIPVLGKMRIASEPYQILFTINVNVDIPSYGSYTSTLVGPWLSKTAFHSQLRNFKLENDGTLSIINQNGRIYMIPATAGVPDTTKGTWGVEFYNSTGVTFNSTTVNW